MLEGPREPVQAMSNASAAVKKPNLVRLDQKLWGGERPEAEETRPELEETRPEAEETRPEGFIFREGGDWIGGDRYAIVRMLGKGGMCEVWLAYDRAAAADDPHRYVAVKVLQSKLEIDETSRRRLKAEALAFMEIKGDPNLPRVYEADIDPERKLFYYVMEYLRGETLEDRIRARGPLSLVEGLHIVASVTEAVVVLHALGIIHRDLKPENVFLTDEGRVVLLDLGVAKFDDERFPGRSTFRTDDTSIAGTFAYMSPEQCMAEKLDPRSDLYALGLIAYGCFAGHHAAQDGPGGWLPSGYRAWSGWHINNKPPPLTLSAPGLPVRVWPVIAKALEKDRKQRWATAADLAVELRMLETFARELDDVAGPLPSMPPETGSPSGPPERVPSVSERVPSVPPPRGALLENATTEEVVKVSAALKTEAAPPREETVSVPNVPPTERGGVAGVSARPRVTRTGTVILPRGTGEAEAAARARMPTHTAQGTEVLPSSRGSQRPPASSGAPAEGAAVVPAAQGQGTQAAQAEATRADVGPSGTARLGKEGAAVSRMPAAGTLARGRRRTGPAGSKDRGGDGGDRGLLLVGTGFAIGAVVVGMLFAARSWKTGTGRNAEAVLTTTSAAETTTTSAAETTTSATTSTRETPLTPTSTTSAPTSAELAPSVTPPAAPPKKVAPSPAKTPRPGGKPVATGKPAVLTRPLFPSPLYDTP